MNRWWHYLVGIPAVVSGGLLGAMIGDAVGEAVFCDDDQHAILRCLEEGAAGLMVGLVIGILVGWASWLVWMAWMARRATREANQ